MAIKHRISFAIMLLALYICRCDSVHLELTKLYDNPHQELKPWICDQLCSCEVDFRSELYAGNCSIRELNSLPNNLSSKFIHLNFSHNLITSIPAKAFGHLELLLTLDLSFNQISSMSETAFVGLHNLKELLLNMNDLALQLDSQPFKPLVFTDLKNLESLNIKNNRQVPVSQCDPSCGYPDSALSHLTKLRNLSMDGLLNKTFGPGFRNLLYLQTLNLGDINGNCKTAFLLKDIFTNLEQTNLTCLRMQNCGIVSIHPDAFLPLKHIHTIDLTWSNLTFSALKFGLTGLSTSPIKILRLGQINRFVGEFLLPEQTFGSLINTTLTDLIFTQNNIINIEQNFIDYLPKTLQNLDLSDNFVVSIGTPFWLYKIPALVNLVSLNLGGFLTNGFHQTQIDYGHAKVQPLLNAVIYQIYVPRNLKYFYMQNNYINLRTIPRLTFTKNRLVYADLSGNKMQIEGPLYNLHNLTHLDLSFGQSKILTTDFFSDMPNMEEILLKGNSLNCLANDTEGKTFSRVHKLKYLDLSNNGIETLHPPIFSHQHELKTLILSTNYLTKWQVKVGHMTNLTFLDLGTNRLTTLDSVARQDLDIVMNTGGLTFRISLIGNPLECSCTNIAFLQWLYKRQEFFEGIHHYSCQMFKCNRSLVNLMQIIQELEHRCLSDTMLTIALVSMVALLITITVVGFVHKHRWEVRFLKHRLALRLKLYQPLLNEDNASYDAFLSYEADQRNFIVNTVYPILEQQQGLKLCIPARDFTPGSPIAYNIYHAVHYSRKTVAFITEAYFKSDWCVYELEMAYLESVHTGQQLLLPVLMETMDTKELPKEKQTILKSLTYLDYTTLGEEQFLCKLSEALQKPAANCPF